MTTKVIITIPVNVDSALVIDATNAALADFLALGVEIEFTTPRLSKSDKVILEMAAIVASGEYVDRNGIAAKVECTVSLISATIKENAELKEEATAKDIADYNTVASYLALEKNAKATKKAQTQLANFLKMQEELKKAGVVINFPTIEAANTDSSENAESVEVTPIKKTSSRTTAKA